jgi:hypothetical protein
MFRFQPAHDALAKPDLNVVSTNELFGVTESRLIVWRLDNSNADKMTLFGINKICSVVHLRLREQMS